MNKNRARRCLTDIDRLLTSQVWTGTPYWMVRTKLWRRADLAVPARVETKTITKARAQAAVDQHAADHVAAQRLEGEWEMPAFGSKVQRVAVVTPTHRDWLRLPVSEPWFVALNEMTSHRYPRDVRVNLNAGAVVWLHGQQVVAVLLGVRGEAQPRSAA